MKGQAIRPDYIIKNMPSMGETPSGSGPSEEEIALASLVNHNGWTKFVNFKEEIMQDMNRANKAAIAQGLSFEQIGQNTIVINMATDIIERLFNKVSDAVEVVEKNGTK